ncbi:putative beta-lactamase family protein [Botrytis fragariae]|uniref:Putative beta-lactamase family protein n=1 Tax=Botrytis fragariae TaxID=1964551 RepID=A0A8H6AWF4_9HELO|nr:putative beta-lactamase family protein [Botrytis fragariae]KAF5874774.1 putative beta-lactamase family protein [Botrytis fragariae]
MDKGIHGYADPRFTELLEVFQNHLNTGEELGASIVVNIDGKNVVDVWGGFRTQDKTENWEHDTVVNVFSTTKTICALALLILVDRGLLNINDKVQKYWAEFASDGKSCIEIRHILSHTSGLSGWDSQMNMSDLFDFDLSATKLAEQEPWWTPGSASGYHSWTYGFLIGQLVRKITGKTLKDFVAQEIADPLGVDFEIGASDKNWHRISSLVFPASKAIFQKTDTTSISAKSFGNPPLDPSVVDSPEWREAEIGSSNGYGNALSIATMLSCISLGGKANGVSLLSNETINLIFQEQSKGIDLVTGQNIRFGIGFGLSGNDTDLKWLPEGRVCTWGDMVAQLLSWILIDA